MIIYLELSGGKPSYNSPALYGVIDVNKQGVTYYKDDESYLDCSINTEVFVRHILQSIF
jgi:hypothetical protein